MSSIGTTSILDLAGVKDCDASDISHSVENILGDALGARVGAFGFGVGFGAEVAGRRGEAVGPPAA